MDLFNYSRRETSEVNIGAVPLGGPNPIRIQSMTNTPTQDTEACVAQAKRIVDAGGEYVRLTTQGVKEAENLMNINIGLRSTGYTLHPESSRCSGTICRESAHQSRQLRRSRTHFQTTGIYRRGICRRTAKDT